MKPYYRKKGKYNDGRVKIVVERQDGKIIIGKTLPKPEVMIKIMDRDSWKKIIKEIKDEN